MLPNGRARGERGGRFWIHSSHREAQLFDRILHFAFLILSQLEVNLEFPHFAQNGWVRKGCDCLGICRCTATAEQPKCCSHEGGQVLELACTVGE